MGKDAQFICHQKMHFTITMYYQSHKKDGNMNQIDINHW